ncbi:PIN domain nuclease, a component of toxin-antitoxin system (PIN domain) [Sphingomonas guangdongensis]|uniref:PIN domain nuclease, a component of toxin-antitoxin system (PIN domain) n=1 Tax=Sphingomonas guangdongensis TaxID=1141890 RepID=A0A285QF49_9SPHN|nr:type II toxin-antitoxin system VapC family toxin [Sphingomonas guangdongensis]SOB80114.1 PIN domain nuclease, a component of toxin-antitoxin system (PIN domain) [Sphingomonas guangdongensis]
MVLIDTHVLIWSVQDDPRLGPKARAVIAEEQERSDGAVMVSAITPWEIAMMAGKGRLTLGRELREWMTLALNRKRVRIAPLEPEIAIDAGTLPGELHGDPADRIIIATARTLVCPLLTMDDKIIRYAEQGHLRVIPAGK